MIKVEWDDIKSELTNEVATINHLNLSDMYVIHLYKGGFKLECALLKDGSNATEITDFETNYISQSNIVHANRNMPFADKKINGKSLFKRVHGIQQAVINGATVIDFTVPYVHCKMTALELVNSNVLDYASLEVYDTAIGTYTGIPDQKLNQFGFDTNIKADFHSQSSEFDSDLYLGMIIRITFTTTIARTIGINYILNEVV